MNEQVSVDPGELGERFAALRLPDPAATKRLSESLERYGQTVPLIAWRAPDAHLELLDGFKRLAALRELGKESVRIQVLELTVQAAHVAVLSLNQTSKSINPLEEGFVIRALVRENGLQQCEVATLLGHDKSWVCRRLSLVEQLSDELQAQLRLGLLDPSRAREMARLPRGNQEEVLKSVRSAELSAHQTAKLVALFLPASRAQQVWMLANPLLALSNATRPVPKHKDVRLGEAATRLLVCLERFAQGSRTLVQGLYQVNLFELTDTERAYLTQKLLLARADAGQVSFSLARALEPHEEMAHATSSGATTASPAHLPETGRLLEPGPGPALPDQSQHGAAAPHPARSHP
jgi:ParB-like chromosome segregation protein Spo0J